LAIIGTLIELSAELGMFMWHSASGTASVLKRGAF